MKKLLIILVLILACVETFAFPITGRVISSEDSYAIEGAYVYALRNGAIIAQSVSDREGKFSLSVKESGDYILQAQMMGFEDLQVSLTNLNGKVDLGDLTMNISNQMLGEVTVQAENIVKVDRQIYFPSSITIKSSFNSLELLSKLMLPDLLINSSNNTITSLNNQKVQLRINGVEVTVNDVTALSPERVQKVEYIDMPGVRYGDAGRVINIVTKRIESGFSTSGTLRAAVTAPFTSDQLNFKYNHRQSEYALSYNYNFSNYKDAFQNDLMTISLPDQELTLERNGIKAPRKNLGHNLTFTYNWRNDKGTIFNAVLRNQWSLPKQTVEQSVFDQLNKLDYNYSLFTKDHTYTPSLNLYFEYPIDKKQAIIANAVGTYISTDYLRDSKEWNDSGDIQRDFSYTTKGDKQTYQGELIYENNFSQKARMTLGVNYKWSHAKNVYSVTLTNKMNTSDLYGYAQLQGSIKKFSYQVGVGLTRQTFEEGNFKYDKFLFRPQLTLAYSLMDNLTVRYNGSMMPGLPELSQTSEFEQWQNDYELVVGNPDLKPYQVYYNQLSLDWRLKRLTLGLSIYYQYNHDYIFNSIYRRSNGDHYYIEYRSENQKNYQHIQPRINLNWQIIKDHLNITAYSILNRYLSHGNNFTRTSSSLIFGAQLIGNYKNWSLTASYRSKGKWQTAETLLRIAPSANIALRYRYNAWQFGVDMQNVFMPNGMPNRSETISEFVYKNSESFIRNEGNMLSFSVSWNFDSGRQYRSGFKKTNNYEDSDSGVMK